MSRLSQAGSAGRRRHGARSSHTRWRSSSARRFPPAKPSLPTTRQPASSNTSSRAIDGELLDPAIVRKATTIGKDGREARLELALAVPAGTKQVRLRVCAVSRAGYLSRPAFVRFERAEKAK